MPKKYSQPEAYEDKLNRVMERLGVEKYNFDWSRLACWVEFYYKGQLYRFEHSVQNAKEHGVNIQYGSDAFAQLVLTLEDIARMTERGIYELQTWVAGLKALPKASEVPDCLKTLGFTALPSADELKSRYRELAKISHPDNAKSGSEEYFRQIKEAYDEAERLITRE